MNKKEQVIEIYRKIFHPELEIYWDYRLEEFIEAIDNLYSDSAQERYDKAIDFIRDVFEGRAGFYTGSNEWMKAIKLASGIEN